ncbi:hypothetical protein [Acinetobacter sp.]|uniref:hypothetical protein n=1 Tax=Acinetobacter sp. TaxID=472 RepID=UPI003CFEACCB
MMTLIDSFREKAPSIREIVKLQDDVYNEYNIGKIQYYKFKDIVKYSIFKGLISKTYISDIVIAEDIGSEYLLAVNSNGFALKSTIQSKARKIDNQLSSYDNRVLYENIFYHEKDKVAAWLKTLPNRNNAFYNMHKVCCEIINPYYDALNEYKGRARNLHDKKLSITFAKRIITPFGCNRIIGSNDFTISSIKVNIYYNGRMYMQIVDDDGWPSNVFSVNILKDLHAVVFLVEHFPEIKAKINEILDFYSELNFNIKTAFDQFREQISPYIISAGL